MPAEPRHVEAHEGVWDDQAWADAASRLLRSQMRLADITNGKLARRMTALGCRETEASVKNKISRGSFTFAFLVQAMAAMGLKDLNVAAVLPPSMPVGRDLDPLAAQNDMKRLEDERALKAKIAALTALTK